MTDASLTRGLRAPRRIAQRVGSLYAGAARPSEARPGEPQPAESQPIGSGPEPVDPRFRRHYWRLGRLVLGEESLPELPEDVRFDQDQAQQVATETRLAMARAVFAERVSQGASIHQAHAATVRAMLRDAGEPAAARAFTLGLEGLPEGREIRAVGIGLAMHKLHYFGFAWRQFRKCGSALLAEVAPVEAVDSALSDGSEEAVERALSIAALSASVDTACLVQLAGRFEVMGHRDVALRLVDEAQARDDAELDEHHRQMLARLPRWTHAAGAAPVGVERGINIGVIDYHSPDYARASRNVGDYVQTLAMLGNLARFQQVRFHGDDGLGDLVTELQDRVRPELALAAGDADVNLLPVSRDYSEGDPIPEDTWCLAFGWHMHPLFLLRHGFPYHRNLNPIFVSFHVNRPDLLTDEAVDYLKTHQPIGCRDWTTVDLLLSAGVDAFFTGCLTTTVNGVFPDTELVRDESDQVVAVIDLPRKAARKARRPVEFVTHADWENKELGLVKGVHAASALLTHYQRRYHRVLTSRLHSYLPATSLGVKVAFTPTTPGDVRFEGLYDMAPGLPAFEGMRDGIRDLIREAFSLILDGAGREAVYAHWSEITADRVTEARRRLAVPAQVATEPQFDVAETVARVAATRCSYGPPASYDGEVTDIALSSDANFRGHLAVTLESIAANASGALRIWITGRGLSRAYQQWLSDAFPDLPITFFDFDDVDYGVIHRMIRHITVTTMDRLLLPDLLPELDRITYVDIDTVTEDDVAVLARTDLAGKPLAARTTEKTGSQIWRSAGNLLPIETATELRRTMSARHGFDFHTFNAGVLVLDLARMRADDFSGTWLQMAPVYGLNDQDILNAYVGADRVELDPRWNALPVMEDLDNPGIVHFAGAGKPWDDLLSPYADRWQACHDRLHARVRGSVPE